MSAVQAPALAFSHCPRCAAPVVPEPPLRFVACAGCGFCLYFNVALATAAFIVRDDGAALFLRRAREPGRGKLGLPGGFVDPGESAEEGLRREVFEETSLEVTHLDFLASFPNTYPYRGIVYPTVDLYFLAHARGVIRRAASEVEDVLWRDPLTLPPDEAAFDSLRLALEALRQRQALA